MLLSVAGSILGESTPLAGQTAFTIRSNAPPTSYSADPGRELLITQSAEVALAQGAGPANGHAESCTARAEGSAECQLSVHPAVANLPSWYDVTNFTGEIPDTYAAAVAWDPDQGNGDLVYFGGCVYGTSPCLTNSTWVYNGDSWANESSVIGTAPPPVAGQSMDWDPLMDGILLVGGEDVNGFPDLGTWLFTDDSWENITSTTGGLNASPASVFGAMAWDPATQSMEYLDGCTNDTCGSVWGVLWSLGASGNWSLSGSFGYVYGESMAYDAADQELVAVGGTDFTGAQLNATWTYAGGSWTNRTASSVGCFFVCDLYPQGRSYASMTWDGQSDSILLFGGINASADLLSDSWSFSGNSWFPFLTNSSFSPPPGDFNSIPVNSSDYAPVMVGGYCSCIGQVYTLDTPPTFEISVVSPSPADIGANVSVTINGSAGAGSGPWLFVDAYYGNSQIATPEIFGVNTSTPWNYTQSQLSYPTAGTYEMEISVEDYFYVNATVFYNLTIVAAPVVTVHASPTTAEVGHAIGFNATVSQGVAPYTYAWNFGDGGTSALVAPTHTYAGVGTYNATLEIIDSGGGNVTGNVTVDVIAGVVAHASSNVTSTDVGLPIGFVGSASSGSGPYGPYAWSFGDGTTASTPSAAHTFAAAGTYQVTLNVTDSLGFVGSASLTVVVNSALAAGAISTNPSSPSSGSTFALAVGITGGTAPFTYAWTFGDGGIASVASPTHSYAGAGTYSVEVVITDALGQKATAHGSVTVTSSSTSGFSLTSGTGLYVLVGVIVAVLVVIALVALMRRGRGRTPAQEATHDAPPPGATGPMPPPPGANP
jgi:PKD repeat protein